jgi:hypothetical protein
MDELILPRRVGVHSHMASAFNSLVHYAVVGLADI